VKKAYWFPIKNLQLIENQPVSNKLEINQLHPELSWSSWASLVYQAMVTLDR
jgi:hypothetical protein